ncbi:MAG: hypothetical protein Q4C61_10225 [Lachnospiraceae bacterium]|nr:hypothetical protein [Lachnospiraceae bacterium]
MLQFIMERNLLLYVLAAACIVGVASQMILKQIYEKLIRDTKNTGEPDGRFLQQLRQRFQYCAHLNEKVGDVHALIQKGMMEYRFWGMSLHRWKRLGVECLVLSLLCAFGGSIFLVRNGGAVVAGNTYFWMGVLAAVLTAAAYGISDTGYRRECLEIRLTDYLENSGAVRDYSESAVEEMAMTGTTPIVPVEAGRKAKKRARAETAAAAQTRAQKEKNDLKENLARIKAGMQETAAERDRGQNLELLRQMDPKEQERILREVLQEILS